MKGFPLTCRKHSPKIEITLQADYFLLGRFCFFYRSPLQSVERVLDAQRKISKADLLILTSDSYHIASVQPDEGAHHFLNFVKKHKIKK